MALSGVQKTVLICTASVALVLGAIVHKVTRPVPFDRNALQDAGVFLFDNPRPIPDYRRPHPCGALPHCPRRGA